MERLASWPVYFRYRIGPGADGGWASSRASTVRWQRKRLIERRPFGHHPVARGGRLLVGMALENVTWRERGQWGRSPSSKDARSDEVLVNLDVA
jgi:hypothetical protein